MKQAYRVPLRRPARRRWAYLLLVAGALCLYIASLPGASGGMKVERRGGVLVTREETLPAREFYIVSLFSTASETEARAGSARFAARGGAGAAAYEAGLYHAVGAALFEREEAEAQCEALLAAEGIDAQPVRFFMPELLLRITATQQQLDALLQAEQTLFSAAEALADAALKIDIGAVDLQGAQGLVFAQAARLRSVGEELEKQISGEKEPVCTALAGLLLDAAQEAERLSGLDSPPRLAFSSAVRALQTDLLLDMIRWREGLG